MPRPHMPEAVKRAAIVINMTVNCGRLRCAETNDVIAVGDVLNGLLHFDHAPPLALRARISVNDKDPESYRPHANDPDFIAVVSPAGHDIRTNKKRGLYRGDQTQIAHSRRVRKAAVAHAEAMQAKAAGVRKPKKRRPEPRFHKKYNRATKRFETVRKS